MDLRSALIFLLECKLQLLILHYGKYNTTKPINFKSLFHVKNKMQFGIKKN